MKPTQDINILPFQPENQAEVKNLVLTGLTEHWSTLDRSKNPDLDDIGLTYANAVFLVAWQKNKIIGTGALVPKSSDTAEIVRMSVATNMRRNGIGRKILLATRQF
jgi:Acetyltransferase (GNAT) family